mgnify:CR=1 FL=1
MKTFKLIVTTNDKCKKVLEYVANCITDINKMGVKVRVEKINKSEFDEDMVELLRKKGITRLPVLIAPDGASFVGVNKITDLFERNLKTLRNGGRVAPSESSIQANPELGSNPELTNFWMSEMYGGKDENGRMIPRKDPDEAQGEGDDIDARLRAYQTRVPRHRGGGAQPERNIEPPARPRRRRNDPPPDENHQPPEDNIAEDDYPDYDIPTATPGTPIRAPQYTQTDEGGADVDQKMMAAWLNNNSGEF